MPIIIKFENGIKEEIKLATELLHLKNYYIRLRELCVWYRGWAKENKYRKGLYKDLQNTLQWKEARKIQIEILRKLNNIPERKYLRCSKCLIPTPEWNLIMHHKEYDWNYIFEQGIQIICRGCNSKIHG